MSVQKPGIKVIKYTASSSNVRVLPLLVVREYKLQITVLPPSPENCHHHLSMVLVYWSSITSFQEKVLVLIFAN